MVAITLEAETRNPNRRRIIADIFDGYEDNDDGTGVVSEDHFFFAQVLDNTHGIMFRLRIGAPSLLFPLKFELALAYTFDICDFYCVQLTKVVLMYPVTLSSKFSSTCFINSHYMFYHRIRVCLSQLCPCYFLFLAEILLRLNSTSPGLGAGLLVAVQSLYLPVSIYIGVSIRIQT